MTNTTLKWLVLFSTGIMIFLVNIDMTIVNLALADISRSIGATINQAQWVITSYFFATALSFTLFGRLADMVGRKRIFLLGVFLFTAGSLWAGLSSRIEVLMLARFVQGLGFAATLGLSLVIIFSNFPDSERGLAAGIAVTITGVAQAIGPTMGGMIVSHYGWPWVFLVNVPLGILSFVMTKWITPTDTMQNAYQKINLSNVFLFVFGLGLVLFAINEVGQLSTLWLIVMLAVGFVSLAIFIYNSHKIHNPLVHVDLLTHKGYRLLVATRFLFMIFMGSSLFILPLYLQNLLGYSAAKAGWVLLGMTLFVAVSSPVVGKLLDKLGFSRPVFASMLFAVLASICFFFFTSPVNWVVMLLGLMFLGLAIGVHTPSTIHGVSVEVDKANAGTALGLFFTLAISGATIGVALSGTLLNFVGVHYLSGHFSQSLTPDLEQAITGVRSVLALPADLQYVATQSFMVAFRAIISVMFVLMLVGCSLSFRLTRLNK